MSYHSVHPNSVAGAASSWPALLCVTTSYKVAFRCWSFFLKIVASLLFYLLFPSLIDPGPIRITTKQSKKVSWWITYGITISLTVQRYRTLNIEVLNAKLILLPRIRSPSLHPLGHDLLKFKLIEERRLQNSTPSKCYETLISCIGNEISPKSLNFVQKITIITWNLR